MRFPNCYHCVKQAYFTWFLKKWYDFSTVQIKAGTLQTAADLNQPHGGSRLFEKKGANRSTENNVSASFVSNPSISNIRQEAFSVKWDK